MGRNAPPHMAILWGSDVESSPIYQRWLYQREVQSSGACGQAPDAAKIRFEDEHISNDEGADADFKCRKCRYGFSCSTFGFTANLLPIGEY